MADKTEKKKAGAIKHYLSKEQFNSLCSVLSFIAFETEENRYTSFADYMLYKLLRYSITIGKVTNENCTFRIQLYPNEAESLLQIYIIFVTGYIRASDRNVKDYTTVVGNKMLGERYDKESGISKDIEKFIS